MLRPPSSFWQFGWVYVHFLFNVTVVCFNVYDKTYPGIHKLKGSSSPAIFSLTTMICRCLIGLMSRSSWSLVQNFAKLKTVFCITLHAQVNAQTGNNFSQCSWFLVAVWVRASFRPPTLWSHETALACFGGLKLLTVPLQFSSGIVNIAVQEDFYLMLLLANISRIHLQTFPYLCTIWDYKTEWVES